MRKCTAGCADCCHAVFDLTLIEALYINPPLQPEIQGHGESQFRGESQSNHRLMAKIKRQAQKDLMDGKPEAEILTDLPESVCAVLC